MDNENKSVSTKKGTIDPGHTPSTLLKLQSVKTIDSLNLHPTAKVAAEKLSAEFPGSIHFTSGRRDINDQASAMAPNVVANRKWIEQTYKNSAQSRGLQAWVDNNPEATTSELITVGLKSVMASWTEEEKTGFSRHITGLAFDLRPVPGELGVSIKKSIAKLPNLQWHTFNEGGREIWHAQFDPVVQFA